MLVFVLFLLMLFPNILLLILVKYKFKCKIDIVFLMLFLFGYLSWFVISGDWIFISYYSRIITIILYVVVSFISIKRNLGKPWFRVKGVVRGGLRIILYSVSLLQLIVGMYAISIMIDSKKVEGDVLRLEFPLNNGVYFVASGGSHEILNHHYKHPSQKFGIDIVKMNKFGLRGSFKMRFALEDFEIYAENVYSPVQGKVVKVIDRAQDNFPGYYNSNSLGNVVVIESQGKFVFILHLMKNSILIKENQEVKVGQLLGKVGNSGKSFEPHLHIHATEKSNNLFNGVPVSIMFDERILIKNSIVKN
ncbi:M23 family metallopeptidase [Paenibacillus sp. P36]|uniref:M23 family metallopeptidase n=1 Tax=Paenibacillus sp. P36 TaxID=3342538 RepID=UPI0038B39793